MARQRRVTWLQSSLRYGLFVAVSVLSAGNMLPAQALELTIMHTNDVHAAYGGFSEEGAFCYAAQCPRGEGGMVRLQQVVRSFRKQYPNNLLLDAGDQFQGSLFYTTYKETLAADMLNQLRYTAMVPGNHEFDEGCDVFASFARRVNLPLVAANLNIPSLKQKKLYKPWHIVERGGRKIAIVGLANEDTPLSSSPCAEAQFTSAATALQEAVTQLEKEGVTIVIALTHLGLNADRRLAQQVDGVDVIVGGHSHTLLSNTAVRREGRYPVVESTPSGETALVVTAGSSAKWLGVLHATFDDEGVVTAWNGSPVRLDEAAAKASGVQADKGLSALLDAKGIAIQKKLRTPLGTIRLESAGTLQLPLDPLQAQVCRVGECVTGNVVADAMLEAARPLGAQCALAGGGSVRASLHTGTVTVGDVLSVLPFENDLVVASLSGKQLLDALEHSVGEVEEGSGRFLQVAGLRYFWSASEPVGSRVRAVSIRQADGTYAVLNVHARYRVVTTSFIAKGGDGYAMLRSEPWQDTHILHSDALKNYILKKKTITPCLEGRIEKTL